EVALDLLRQGRGGRGEAEVEALLAVVPEDHSELPDPLELAARKVRGLLGRVVRGSWTPAVAGGLLVLAVGGALVVAVLQDEPRWARWLVAGSLVGLYRLAPWEATAVMVVALLALGVVAAEKVRLEQAGEGAAH